MNQGRRSVRRFWTGLIMVVIFALYCLAVSILRGDERAEVERLAPKYGGEAEVQLWDGTRVDLVTQTHAIEVDWAKPGKHFEAVGQSLYYAQVTGKKPGVILLVTDARLQARFVYRTAVVCARVGIDLWVEVVDEDP